VHAAGVQDRDGAALVLDRRTRALFPFVLAIFADAGYRGPRAADAARRSGRWRLRIVRRAEATQGFVVLPKRWIVERTLSWLTRCRRLARNLENLARTSVALIRLAMIKLMARRLARSRTSWTGSYRTQTRRSLYVGGMVPIGASAHGSHDFTSHHG
jgi:putative transposase